jgi:ATP-dependent Clp protease adaptor protein ClpS
MTPVRKTRKQSEGREQERETSPRTLVLHNDNFNTFDHVIECLIEVCGHDEMQAEQCALITHLKGSCEIKKGPEWILETMREDLHNKELSVSIED